MEEHAQTNEELCKTNEELRKSLHQLASLVKEGFLKEYLEANQEETK